MYRRLRHNAANPPQTDDARARRNAHELLILSNLGNLRLNYPPLMGLIADIACKHVEIGNLSAQPVAGVCVHAAQAAYYNDENIVWVDPLVVLHKKLRQADREEDPVGRYIQAMLPPGSEDYTLVKLSKSYARRGRIYKRWTRQCDSAGAVYFERKR